MGLNSNTESRMTIWTRRLLGAGRVAPSLVILSLLSLSGSHPAFTADSGADPGLGAGAGAGASVDANAATSAAEDRVIPIKKKKRNPYKRSRLTNDSSELTADHRMLILASGEDKAVDLDFDANAGANGIGIGNPNVIVTTLVKIGEKRQIVFKPLHKGETTVTVRDADGNIRLIFHVQVHESNLLRRAGEIRDLLKDIEGIDVRVVGQKVVVDGELLVPSDYGRLISVLSDKIYGELVLNLATLSPLAMQVLAKKIQQDVNVFAPSVTTRVVNGMIFLEGTVDNADHSRRAEEVAKLYLPDVRPGNPLLKDQFAQVLTRKLVNNFILVNPPPQKKQEKLVRITVHFVELNKDYSRNFGFKWMPGFTAGSDQMTIGQKPDGSTGVGDFSFSATISNLFPKLQSMQDAGYARVLKTGTVLTRSGQPAELDERTQIPYTVTNGQQAQSATANVGMVLSVTPSILGQSDDIQMDVDVNQESLTSTTKSGSPITTNHRVKTKLYVKSTESAAVAGVMASDVGTQFNKSGDPNNASFGGSTDPLFTLLHSKQYYKKKSQFVIFVTPQIVENASDGTDDLKKHFRVRVK